MPDAIERLPADARGRLQAFAAALERIRLEDLPLYAVQTVEPAHGATVERARAAAAASGLDGAVDVARDGLTSYLERVYADAQFRSSGAALQWGSLGTLEERMRLTQSLGDAAAAVVLWEQLDEADRAEMLGEWARLLP